MEPFDLRKGIDRQATSGRTVLACLHRGKLDWSAIPFDEPIPLVVSGILALIIVAVLGWVTIKGYVPYRIPRMSNVWFEN